MEFATCGVVVAIVDSTSTRLDWTCYVIFDLYIFIHGTQETANWIAIRLTAQWKWGKFYFESEPPIDLDHIMFINGVVEKCVAQKSQRRKCFISARILWDEKIGEIVSFISFLYWNKYIFHLNARVYWWVRKLLSNQEK